MGQQPLWGEWKVGEATKWRSEACYSADKNIQFKNPYEGVKHCVLTSRYFPNSISVRNLKKKSE